MKAVNNNWLYLFAGNCGKGKTLLHRVLPTCEEQGISFVQYMCSDSYSNQCNRKLKLFPKNDGLVDSVKTLVASKTEYNRNLLN